MKYDIITIRQNTSVQFSSKTVRIRECSIQGQNFCSNITFPLRILLFLYEYYFSFYRKKNQKISKNLETFRKMSKKFDGQIGSNTKVNRNPKNLTKKIQKKNKKFRTNSENLENADLVLQVWIIEMIQKRL